MAMKRQAGPPTSDSAPAPDGAALIFRPLLISGMVTCIAASWVIALESLSAGCCALEDWRGGYLIPLVAVVALETLVAEQQLRMRRSDSTYRLQVHLAEMALMLLLLKPASYLQRGWQAFWQDAPRWFYQPAFFLDDNYAIGAMVLLVMWLMAMNVATYLAALQDPFHDLQDREQGLDGLKKHFAMGALILLAMVGLQRLNLAAIGFEMRPVHVSELTLLPLAYFGLGLLLFGQVRLSLLQSGWIRNGIPVAPGLVRRWVGWGLLFVGGVTALALLLPAGSSSSGFLVLYGLASVIVFVGQILVFIPFLLLALILSPCLFLFHASRFEMPSPPELPSLLPSPATSGPSWFFYLRTILAWAAIFVFLFLILRTYWRDRQEAGSWKMWGWLLSWWRNLWAWLWGWTKRVDLRLWRRVGKPTSQLPTAPPSWWRRWQAKTARERVRRLYLALLQRAERAGHPRRLNQTPYEYAAQLEPHLAEERDALSALTQAFVEARYSQRAFGSHEVSLLRRIWQRLQAALRKCATHL